MKNYEGMFLVDSREGKKGAEAVEEQIKALIVKCGGEVKEFEKWDERKICYEIGGTSNGTYFLSYFLGGEETISKLNREVRLSSFLLRALFLRIKEIPSPEERYAMGTRGDDSEEEGTDGGHGDRRDRSKAAAPREDTDEASSEDAPDSEEE